MSTKLGDRAWIDSSGRWINPLICTHTTGSTSTTLSTTSTFGVISLLRDDERLRPTIAENWLSLRSEIKMMADTRFFYLSGLPSYLGFRQLELLKGVLMELLLASIIFRNPRRV